jgi:hypothetical protein
MGPFRWCILTAGVGGALALWLVAETPALARLVGSSSAALLALTFVPTMARPPGQGSLGLGAPGGTIVADILLRLVWWAAFTPAAWLLRLVGWDAMRRRTSRRLRTAWERYS